MRKPSRQLLQELRKFAMSEKERTGWRDERISQMHRLWGNKLSFMNIDDIWVECVGTKCMAFFEYKLDSAKPITHDDWQIKVLVDAAAGRPAFFVRYSNDGHSWKVVSLNASAKLILQDISEMTFADFIRFQYGFRGLKIDDEAIHEICVEMGWVLT